MTSHLALVKSNGSRHLVLERRSTATLQVGDLLCRTQFAGVCGTDLQILRGLRDDPASVLGHEGIAVVEAAAARGDEAMIGQPILINPTDPTTGIATFGHTEDGLMQELIRIPARLRHQTLQAMPGLKSELAVLTEPLASVLLALGVIQRIRQPRRVLAIGRGTIGQLLRIALPRFCASLEDTVIVGASSTNHIPSKFFDVVILCTTPDQIALAIRLGLDALQQNGVLHLFGGVPKAYDDPHFPGINLSHIRSHHSGRLGVNSIGVRVQTPDGAAITISGHRGASNGDMISAMQELISNGSAYQRLITILSNPLEALRALNDAIDSPLNRTWIKLGIDMRTWSAMT